MKNHSEPFLSEESLNPARPKARAVVRYLGFGIVQGQRRLNFSVKPFGMETVDITVDIPDTALVGLLRISLQDAVPIAYGKLVRLSHTQDVFEVKQLWLTDEDITQYRKLRGIETKRTGDSIVDRLRRSGFAA